MISLFAYLGVWATESIVLGKMNTCFSSKFDTHYRRGEYEKSVIAVEDE